MYTGRLCRFYVIKKRITATTIDVLLNKMTCKLVVGYVYAISNYLANVNYN